MTQEPDNDSLETRSGGDNERPRDGGSGSPGDRPAQMGDVVMVRAGLAVALFGYLGLVVDWSWLVVGAGVAAMMFLPRLGNVSLAVMGGLVLFIGAVHGWSWVLILTGLLVMIFLHELGHFLTARWSGMKATELFLGFGPKLWSFTRGETEYGVKAIPAGAYVRIIGMTTAEEVPPEDESRTYRQKSFPKRLLVVSAGSLMHLGQALVAAVVLLVFVGVPGGTLVPEDRERDSDWVVADAVSDGSAADVAGLTEGDRIVEWDGRPVASFIEVRDEVGLSEVGEPVTLAVLRDGDTFEVTTDVVDRLLLVYGGEQELEPGLEVVGEVEAPGVVTAWDGEQVATYAELQDLVSEAAVGEEVPLTVRGEGGRSFEVTVEVADPPSDHDHSQTVEAVPFLGVGPTLEDDRIEDQTLGAFGGVAQAGKDTGELLWLTADGIAGFFNPANLAGFFESAANGGRDTSTVSSGGVSPVTVGGDGEDQRDMMSIVGIARLAANLDPAGLLMAFFAVNLTIGLINMAPLLPLDGGHAMVAVYERLRSRNGKRHFVDADKLMPLAYAGLFLILAIGFTAIFLDIVDPIEM